MITALIMAGGEGTRFWPLSRKNHPKQFLKFTDDQLSMLQATADRVSELVPMEQIFIATNESYKKPIAKQLTGIPEQNIIVEPFKRDTAACIGLSSIIIEERYPGSTMIVLPADHLIEDRDRFVETLKRAVKLASAGENLITLGIIPTGPETGYGYIHCGNLHKNLDGFAFYQVKNFIEKPDIDRARKFVQFGSYLWNSGIFVWQAKTILDNIDTYMPELSNSLQRIKSAFGTDLESSVIEDEFEQLDSVSIDIGIMEKANNIYVIPGNFGWDDLGSWPALERVKKLDSDGNIIIGKHYGIDTSNSIIHSKDKVVATIGMNDVIVVDTEDAILVCDKKRAQEVKELRKILEENGLDEYL